MKTSWTALAIVATVGASTGAHAQSASQILQHNASVQAHLGTDVARGTLALDRAATLEDQAATLYRLEATPMQANANDAMRQPVLAAQHELQHAGIDAERAGTRQTAARTSERLHARVAGLREAPQQRWIAYGLRDGRLSSAQVATLEASQADVAAAQAARERRGNETVQEALRIQPLQAVQDWAIKTARPLA